MEEIKEHGVVICDKALTQEVLVWNNIRVRELNKNFEAENNEDLDHGV